ncbi:MAG: type III-B CRISPR module RAMP protein Cmr4 [Anaerolineae bacterium]|nr:type III-B CRISPR module RAMP protein Cmr4 [Anaerolineae bacterium]
MFQAARMMFIYVETPLHAGSGRSLGTVDLPIQRERATDYPMVQASGIKGSLRAETYTKDPKFQERFRKLKAQYENDIPPEKRNDAEAKEKAEKDARRQAARETGLEAIFGPEAGTNASEHAGALAVGDARLLLFPVRSLAGVFAWVTSPDALARFMRDAKMTGLDLKWESTAPQKDEAWVNGNDLVIDPKDPHVVLEEFSFIARQKDLVGTIGKWLADHALRGTDEYHHWRQVLPAKLCILPEDAFRDFVLYATEVQTHIKLDPEKKTVAQGALWTSESLPVDTLLYAPFMATQSREAGTPLQAEEVLQKIVDLNLDRIQLGGDETTGQGIVALRFDGGEK